MLPNPIKRFIVVFILIQLLFTVLRYTTAIDEGVPGAQLHRFQHIVTVQLVMFGCTRWLIFPRLNYTISTLLRSRSTLLLDVSKMVLIALLTMSHACFLLHLHTFVRDDGTNPHWLALVAFLSLGVYIHLVAFLLAAATFEMIIRRCKYNMMVPTIIDNRHVHNICALIFAIILTIFGAFVANRSPTIRHVNVYIRELPTNLVGFRLALLTDLHIGPTVGKRRVQQIVDATNQLQPGTWITIYVVYFVDLITIAGDLVDGFVPSLASSVAPLKQLSSTHGVYFATGNHEYYHDSIDRWFAYFRSIGIRPLHNEHVKINHPSNGQQHPYLCLAGVDDIYSNKLRIPGHKMNVSAALTGCDSNSTIILLTHQPNAAQIILDESEFASSIDLVLSGHTHAGQLYTLVPLAYWGNAYYYGLYTHDRSGAQIYVSSGVNYWGPPVKMAGRCEIVLIELLSS